MLKWLRARNTSTRVAVIESLPVDGKRSVMIVRRDNIEHLVMVGGRNDLVIEPNIMRRAAPKSGGRPTPEWKGLPPAPTREPLAEPPSKSLDHNLQDLTRRLEAELRGSPPRRSQSSPPPPRREAQSSGSRPQQAMTSSQGANRVFDTRAEPTDEPKIHGEVQPDGSLDGSTEPEDKDDVQHRT
jgi:flagellar protein FliO/FliZ